MGKISLIIPEATTNLISNPSIENAGTTGWVVSNSAIARVVTESKFGVASLEVATNDAGNFEGIYFSIDPLGGAGVDYTGSAWLREATGGTVIFQLWDQDNGVGTNILLTLTADWQRWDVTHTMTAASTDLRLRILTNPQQGITFYLDAAQIEQGPLTTYADGDQSGCEWLGGDHASTSSRSAEARAGGTVVDLDDYNVIIDTLIGFEVPPLRHNVHGLSLQPGAYLQSVKVMPRVLQLVGHTDTETESAQYTALQNLVAAVAEDQVAVLQPVVLRYTGTATTVEIGCYYDAGLEGAFRCDGHSRFTMRLIAYDPFWREIGEIAETLDTNDSTAVDETIGLVGPAWDDLGPPNPCGAMEAVAIGLDKLVYYGGDWLDHDTDPAADYIAKWDPVALAWSAVAAGGTGKVNDIAVGPDGTLYIVGDFLVWGGDGNANYIATWDGAAYGAVAAGGTGEVTRIAIDPTDGSLYLCGPFLNWDGAGTSDFIVKYDAIAADWVDITAAGRPTFEVRDVVVAPNGILYAGGFFQSIGGEAADFIASYDGVDWAQVGDGLSAPVRRLAIAPDGTLYASGGVGAINKWDGSSWSVLGDGLDDLVWAMAVVDNGDVIAGGQFALSGSLRLDGIGRWNGHTWSNMGVRFAALGWPNLVSDIAVGFYDPVVAHNYDVYIARSVIDTMTSKGLLNLTNEGTAFTFPRITIARAGDTSATLLTIKNETTGLEMLFNLNLLDGETITIDLTPGNKTVQSSWRGNIIGALLPNSDFASFGLQPGDNDISVFVREVGAPTITASIIWRNQYRSVSGAE